MERNAVCLGLAVAVYLICVPALAEPEEVAPGVRASGERVAKEASAAADRDGNLARQLHAFPVKSDVRRHVVGMDGEVARAPSASSRLLYSNTLGRYVFGPNAGLRVADDILVTYAAGCSLDRFVFRVSGDKELNPDVDYGPFSVDYALYPTCPNANASPEPIPGTTGAVDLPDEGFHDVEVQIPLNVCAGGERDGLTCSEEMFASPECSFCQGGLNDGLSCSGGNVCPGVCVGGSQDGQSCNSSYSCPDGDCESGSCEIRSCGVSLPSSFFFAVTFSRHKAGIVVGAPALVGLSADRFDFPGFACASAFGGFPTGPHGSFYLEMYVRGPCDRAFPGYRNSMQSGSAYSTGTGGIFADDITLGVDSCDMVAYEVSVRGMQSNSSGAVQVQLHTFLDRKYPLNTGMIPATRRSVFVSGNDVEVLRADFSPPIPLPSGERFWALFRTASSVVGPLATCKDAWPGSTQDLFWGYSTEGDGSVGEWEERDLQSNCYSAFDLTIYCAGEPPKGACCDLILKDGYACVGGPHDGSACVSWDDCRVCEGGSTDGAVCSTDADCPGGQCPRYADCIGDSVCRELPEMNCTDPELWVQGERCGPVCVGGSYNSSPCTHDYDCPDGTCEGSFCVGGVNDGLGCSREADCPEGDCVGGPFRSACGVGKCCTYDDLCLDVTERECRAHYPGGGPSLFDRQGVCWIDYPHCPFGACLGREGDCSLAHPERGCGDPFCCTDVCNFDPFCCYVEWDDTCVIWSQDFCGNSPPSTDYCYSSDPRYEALWVSPDSSTVLGNVTASTYYSDPGFCCHGDEPGTRGVGNVWLRFVAPEPVNPGDETVSVEVDTCGSAELLSVPVHDSMIQLLALTDPDRGICEDETVCSVAGQDCADGLPCRFDEAYACQNFIPIGCSDDAGEACVGPGGSAEPNNARVCATDLIPGQTYYIMVASKSVYDRGVFQVNVSSPCEASGLLPLIPNDLCQNAEPLTGSQHSVPFDLSGGGVYAPVTLDCPGPPEDTCLRTMVHDVWYDWVAPANGKAVIDTCAGEGELTPDTAMVVYRGCECPADPLDIVGCSDFLPTDDCFSGSRIEFSAVEGECYKIRTGGRNGTLVAGNLNVTLLACPEGPVSFLDPPSGIVDARQPHPPTEPGSPQGLDSFVVSAPPGADTRDDVTGEFSCWLLCETYWGLGGTPNEILNVTDNLDGTYTLELARPISAPAVTKITFTGGDGSTSVGEFTSHPGDVNGDAVPRPNDISALLAILSGQSSSVWGVYSEDIDRSGALGPSDVLRLIDLLNGAAEYLSWWGVPLPVDIGLCP